MPSSMPASSPATFTVTGTSSQIVSFSIPFGVYTAAQWDIAFNSTGSGGDTLIVTTSSSANSPASFTSPTTTTRSWAADSLHLSDINAMAGGMLSVTLGITNFGDTVNVTSFTLTLTSASVATVVEMLVTGGGDVALPPVDASLYGLVVSEPPPAVVNNITYLRFSQCRDGRGATWTEEIAVVEKVDPLSAAGCWLDNRYGVLYSTGNALKWLTTDRPDQWDPSTAMNVSATSGHVYGLAVNSVNIICALVGTIPLVSRDRGKTWTAYASLPLAGLPGDAPTLVALNNFFVIVQPRVATHDVKHYISLDCGKTWK